MSFGVSFSQTKRNKHGEELCTKIGKAIILYTDKLIEVINKAPDDALTE